MLKNFKTYQCSLLLYKKCSKLKLKYNLKDQLDRASSSVVLNLAEGSGKITKRDQRKFYSIAWGSLNECRGVLEISNNFNGDILDSFNLTAAHLYKLLKYYGAWD